MKQTHRIKASQEIDDLPIGRSTITAVSVGQHGVDLVLMHDDGPTVVIRIETAATICGHGGVSKRAEAGPPLGAELLRFIGGRVDSHAARGLDLVLRLSDAEVQIEVDHSGYESYEITIGDEVYVATGSSVS